MINNLPANVGEAGDAGSILGSGRSPGGGNGNPLQYSCLENSMDREAWWAIAPRGHKELNVTEDAHMPKLSIFKSRDSELPGPKKVYSRENGSETPAGIHG